MKSWQHLIPMFMKSWLSLSSLVRPFSGISFKPKPKSLLASKTLHVSLHTALWTSLTRRPCSLQPIHTSVFTALWAHEASSCLKASYMLSFLPLPFIHLAVLGHSYGCGILIHCTGISGGPALGGQSLSHWTINEDPWELSFQMLFSEILTCIASQFLQVFTQNPPFVFKRFKSTHLQTFTALFSAFKLYLGDIYH